MTVKHTAFFYLTSLLLTTTHITSTSASTETTFNHRRPRILGGNEAQPHEFPYMVTLYRKAKPHYYCGGAILNENWILTAAHCQLPKNKRLRVKVGKHSLSKVENSEQVVDVSKVIAHKNYKNPYGGHDIALLKLEKPLIFNEFVKPVSLPKKGREFSGQTVFAGWGYIENDKLPDNLRKASLSIIDIDICRQADSLISNKPSSIVSNKMICTGPLTSEISLCQGDSGGPLVKRRVNKTDGLVGVASFTLDSCGSPSTASVYTKVSHYVDWIKNVMDKN